MQRYPGSLKEALVGWKMPWEKTALETVVVKQPKEGKKQL